MMNVSRKGFCLLKNKLREVLPAKVNEFKTVKKELGSKVVGEYTVEQVLGGMRGIKGMFYETSKLDNETGIQYRSKNLYELIDTLKKEGSAEPSVEGLLWYLLTGDLPSQEEIAFVEKNLYERAEIPKWVEETLMNLPADMHPMTKLITGVNLLQTNSKFAKKYEEGIKRTEFWEWYYEDSLDLIAKLPRISAIIFNKHVHNKSTPLPKAEYNQSQNLAYLLGKDDPAVHDLFAHYLFLHSDHEGGNVSAHATTLVGSTLADPYKSYSAGLSGLAGPLHGLANQETLRWLTLCKQTLGDNISDEDLKKYCQDWLASGNVIPGYGHAVLRKTDPRYLIQNDFADKHMPEDPLYKLVKQCYNVIPPILQATGKVKNPWPNVDCSSGVLLTHFGLTQYDFYTVYFGISRAYGALANLILSRAIGVPIERPASVTLQWIKDNVKH